MKYIPAGQNPPGMKFYLFFKLSMTFAETQ